MNMNSLISDLYVKHDKNQISRIKDQLETEQKEFNVFFDEFLELFSDKLNGSEDPKDPVWKAYKDKYKQWTEINSNLKIANYYLGML
jgi:hypothetical protein